MLDIGFDIGHSSTVVTVFRVGLSLRHALEKRKHRSRITEFLCCRKGHNMWCDWPVTEIMFKENGKDLTAITLSIIDPSLYEALEGGRGYACLLQKFKPFHLAIWKGPHITVGNYFNSNHLLSMIFWAQCCHFNAVLEFYYLYGRLESFFIVSS